MTCQQAFNISWNQYWGKIEELVPREDFETIVEMGLKSHLRNAYKSGFYTARDLSIQDKIKGFAPQLTQKGN